MYFGIVMDIQSKLTLFSTFNNSFLICHEKEKKELLNSKDFVIVALFAYQAHKEFLYG